MYGHALNVLALDQEIAELYADKVLVRDPLLHTSGGRQ